MGSRHPQGLVRNTHTHTHIPGWARTRQTKRPQRTLCSWHALGGVGRACALSVEGPVLRDVRDDVGADSPIHLHDSMQRRTLAALLVRVTDEDARRRAVR